MDNMQEWMGQEAQEITLEQMDQMIRALSIKRAEHKAAKEAASLIYQELEEAESRVIGALKASGKTKYEAEGVGLAYISHKTTYTTPKTIEDKTKLFNYIKEKHGPDSLMGLVSINHQSLNSWANKETENEPLFKIPGLAEPTAEEVLNFRAKKGLDNE